jgi:transcriptional regulator with XRE-family HTH domain
MPKPTTESHLLLDALKQTYKFASDKELAEFLNMPPSAISKVRIGNNGPSAFFILKVHKATKWPVERIEFLCPAMKEQP